MLGLTPVASGPLNQPALGEEFVLVADKGDFLLNGQDVDFILGEFFAKGDFTLNGQDVEFLVQEKFQNGSFTLNGQDADLIFSTPLAGTTFTLTQFANDLFKHLHIKEPPATTYNLSGFPTVEVVDRVLNAEKGDFTLNMQEAAVGIPQIMLSSPGYFNLTQFPLDAASINTRATLLSNTFNLVGQDIEADATFFVDLAQGSFALNGQPLEVRRDLRLTANTGSFTLNPQTIAQNRTRSLVAEEETFNVVGFPLLRLRDDAPTTFAVVGFDIDMRRGKAPRFNFNGTASEIFNPLPYDDAIIPAFYVKAGDISPALRTNLLDGFGDRVNLTNATARFHMRELKTKTTVLDALATVADDRLGVVQYNWKPGETSTPGIYQAEFEITYPDGSQETFPSDGYIDVEIKGKVA